MTAGRGIIHSEMPQQEAGRMRGFQLWINLPAAEKMKPAGYRDIQADEIPVVAAAGRRARQGDRRHARRQRRRRRARFRGCRPIRCTSMSNLPAGATLAHPIAPGYHAFVYPFEGSVTVGPPGASAHLATHHAGVLSDGDRSN